MTVLHMISLPLDLRELRRCAALRDLSTDEGRALHHFLSETFGKGVVKPFRLMVGQGSRTATLYAYTAFAETALRQNAETTAPEVWNALGLAHLAVKEMPGQWGEGHRLAFDVRMRPVRRLLKPLEGWSRQAHHNEVPGRPTSAFRKGAEVDAFLVARLRRYPDGVPAGEDGMTRESVYLDWLEERLAGAVRLDRACTRLVRFERSKVARNEPCEGPDATFHGEFTVTDGQAFMELLSRGLGRHTAYGYGMLLLRPARG